MDPFHRLLSYSAYVSAPDKGAIHHNCDATFIEAFDSLQASHTRSTDTSFNMDLSLRKALISYRDVEQLLIPRAIDQWKTISTRYDFEYWRRQLMARRQMVRDRFRRTVHKLALKDKLKIKEHTDPFARFIGARSPELRASVQKTITKERKHFMRQIFQYAVRREVMRRRAANPGSDPWNSFFFNAYRLAKPVREETSSQRHKMNLRTSIRRKLSTAPAMLQASIEEVEDDAPLSSSSSSNILLHDQTVFQVFSSFALHSLTGDDKVESAAVRVSSSSLSSETSPPPRLRPPTPPSTAGGVRRLSRSRERRLQIQLQSRDVGRDGQVVETIEIVHHYGGERRKSSGRSDFDAFVDHLARPLDRHLRSPMYLNAMPRRAKSQREPNRAIERLANANVRRSNVYCDPLTLDKILRRNEQRAAPIRTRSELPRWNIQRPTHSPDGKPPPLPRLTWLPFIDVMNQQKSTSSSPTTTRRVPFY